MLLPGVTGEVVRLKVRVWPPLSLFCLVLPTLYLSLSSYLSSFIPSSLCLYISHFLSLPLPLSLSLSLSHSISVSIHSSIYLRIYPPLLSFSISHSLSLPPSLSIYIPVPIYLLKGSQAEGDNIEKTWWREWSNRQDSRMVPGEHITVRQKDGVQERRRV